MAQDEPGRIPDGDGGLASLDERLRSARIAETARTETTARKPRTGYNQGARILTELVAGPAGGGIVGWLLDRWLGTSPWLLMVMLFLGFGVAVRNIYRISNERPE